MTGQFFTTWWVFKKHFTDEIYLKALIWLPELHLTNLFVSNLLQRLCIWFIFYLQMASLSDKNSPDSNGSYYVLTSGGLDQNNLAVSTTDVYNSSNRAWIPAPPMIIPRARHTLTPVGNMTRSMVAVGGIQVSYSVVKALNRGKLCSYLVYRAPVKTLEDYPWFNKANSKGLGDLRRRFKIAPAFQHG